MADTYYAGDPFDVESSILEIGTFSLAVVVRICTYLIWFEIVFFFPLPVVSANNAKRPGAF